MCGERARQTHFILYDTPKFSKHWLSSYDTVSHCERLPMHPCKIILGVQWTGCQAVHYELLPMGKTVSTDLYLLLLEHVQQASQQKLALINCKIVLFLYDNARSYILLVWSRIPYGDLVGRLFAILLTYLTMHCPIMISFIQWIIIFIENPSAVKQTFAKLSHFLVSKIPKFYHKGIAQLEIFWKKMLHADSDYFKD